MFPEIARDDIFRVETRRLWLRAPLAADVAPPPPGAAADAPHRSPEALAAWRGANAAGRALHLLATGRGADRRAIGALALEPVRGRAEGCGLRLTLWIDAPSRGRGLGTEAAQAAADVAFALTGAPLVCASARVLDPAFRRVLEKCGFTFCGMGLEPAAEGHGLAASDRFRLDRGAWASLKAWRTPALPGQAAGAPA